jgi:hypothetical protein
MISMWVMRWMPALTSSWHFTINTPWRFNTRFASMAALTYNSSTASCHLLARADGLSPFE